MPPRRRTSSRIATTAGGCRSGSRASTSRSSASTGCRVSAGRHRHCDGPVRTASYRRVRRFAGKRARKPLERVIECRPADNAPRGGPPARRPVGCLASLLVDNGRHPPLRRGDRRAVARPSTDESPPGDDDQPNRDGGYETRRAIPPANVPRPRRTPNDERPTDPGDDIDREPPQAPGAGHVGRPVQSQAPDSNTGCPSLMRLPRCTGRGVSRHCPGRERMRRPLILDSVSGWVDAVLGRRSSDRRRPTLNPLATDDRDVRRLQRQA